MVERSRPKRVVAVGTIGLATGLALVIAAGSNHQVEGRGSTLASRHDFDTRATQIGNKRRQLLQDEFGV